MPGRTAGVDAHQSRMSLQPRGARARIRSRHDATAPAPPQRPAPNDRATATAAVIAARRRDDGGAPKCPATRPRAARIPPTAASRPRHGRITAAATAAAVHSPEPARTGTCPHFSARAAIARPMRRRLAAICLTIVNGPPRPAFNLAMRRSPAYAVRIRSASNALRRGMRIRARPPSPARFATSGASAPQAPGGRPPFGRARRWPARRLSLIHI